jgi:glycosyltransferase involved in cell wall biosynthesis
MRISIIIPAYNEKGTILDLIRQVQSIQSVSTEIIVVDDASTDGTRELLRALSAPDVRVLFHETNRGKGAALRTGFAQAGGDIIMAQDADLELDLPRSLPDLIRPIITGQAEMVYGSRFQNTPFSLSVHYLANRFLTELSNLFSGLRLTDMETCYKIFSKPALDGIVIEEDRFGVEPELTAYVGRRVKDGFRLTEVAVPYIPRGYSEGKKIGWRDGLWAVWCIVKYNLKSR